MRKLIVALSVLFTASAFAKLNKNSSWEKILANKDIQVDVPQITFAGPAATHFVSVLNVCVYSETKFRTKNKVTVYEWGGTGDNNSPIENGKAYLYAPRTISKKYCLKENCQWEDDFETVVTHRPLTYRVDILGDEIGDSGNYEVLFTKKYTIPVCE